MNKKVLLLTYKVIGVDYGRDILRGEMVNTSDSKSYAE